MIFYVSLTVRWNKNGDIKQKKKEACNSCVEDKKIVTDMNAYCSDCYKLVALGNAYEVPMVSMPDRQDWTAPKHVLEKIVLLPKYKRLPG